MANKVNFKLKKLADSIIKEKKNANMFVDLIVALESDVPEVVTSSINETTRVCCHLLNSGEIVMGSNKKKPESEMTAKERYSSWMRERYRDACSSLCNQFNHNERFVRDSAMRSMMSILQAEGTNGKEVDRFPFQLLFQIVNSMMTEESGECSDPLMIIFIETFQQEFNVFDDLRFYIMKALYNAVSKAKVKPFSLERMFHLMKNLNMPSGGDNEILKHFYISFEKREEDLKFASVKEQKKLFSSLWVDFLALELSPNLYENVLTILHDKVMPFMASPLSLSDFLVLSCSMGGCTSLLALNGLFILMNSYNLDYPDFYKKLYALLEPSIFHVPYTSRFMTLLDRFLASTHLSASLVAAFVKRLARISLTLSSISLPVVVTLIINLLNRHPNCKVLVHKIRAIEGLHEDPFVEDEKDPMKCKALESSLWEIKTLENHFHHSVSELCKKINCELPKVELDYKKHLKTNYTTLMDKERKKKFKKAPENYFAKTPSMQTPVPELWTF